MLKYWVTDVHFVVVKDGFAWQRVRDLSNPPNITACDCCMPHAIKKELKVMGIIPGYQDYSTNPKHPSEEEWLEVKNNAD
jgi:hypothetical protein